MACNTITTGQGFLVETLAHLDCQAQVIGSYGFQALADPGSPATTILTALLTLFIALFGIRLLFGGQVGMRDGVSAMLKIGIVLTLAVSWPAFRTLAYDTVLHGPAEIAGTIGGSSLPDMQGGLAQRLQGIDDGIVSLTGTGSGRQTGQLEVPGEGTGSFRGVAMQDETAFGWGRTAFLAGAIGALATLRIAAGLLLALTPLIAGLLLFDLTRGIFSGWLRGLVLTAIGSLGVTVLLAVEVAVMEPWLAEVLERRNLGYATPAAPTELFALSLGFAAASLVLLGILARVAFQNAWPMADWFGQRGRDEPVQPEIIRERMVEHAEASLHSRALAVGEGVRMTMRHEASRSEYSERRVTDAVSRSPERVGQDGPSREALGSSYRRNVRRTTGSHQRRDTPS